MNLPNGLILSSTWNGNTCSFTLTNTTSEPIRVPEITLLARDVSFSDATRFYGEGYQMLSQYTGTLNNFHGVANLTDNEHYKFPSRPGFFTVYNLAVFNTQANDYTLVGFSSCHRFNGKIYFNHARLEVALDCENKLIAAGETRPLEDVYFEQGDYNTILSNFGDQIARTHARPMGCETPGGWCSWYCYGSRVTEKDVLDNAEIINAKFPHLKYILLDDGYQNKMGDWLTPHPNFPNGIQRLCQKISALNLTPSIWVAPFIAEPTSELFINHPDWFIKDDHGAPLCSADVTFRGWRCSPWYMLDGTHPEAQNYIRNVFRTMRNEWGCRFFKLDANTWGAMPFGHRYIENATSVEAYRMGMQAVREGAGNDSFILGCNAPLWPSIGNVDGMRNTGDISRNWATFQKLSEECFFRNWQHEKLWVNDPDCIVLENLHSQSLGPDGVLRTLSSELTDAEFDFHKAHILASGGIILSGDKLMELSEKSQSILDKLIHTDKKPAQFTTWDFNCGKIEDETGITLFLFNKNQSPAKFMMPLSRPCHVTDFWTDETVFENTQHIFLERIPKHGARVLRCTYI